MHHNPVSQPARLWKQIRKAQIMKRGHNRDFAHPARQKVNPGRHLVGGSLELQIDHVQTMLNRPGFDRLHTPETPATDRTGQGNVAVLCALAAEDVDLMRLVAERFCQNMAERAHTALHWRIFTRNDADAHYVTFSPERRTCQ